MPLLITALERAMRLAESMEARGFGAADRPGQSQAESSRNNWPSWPGWQRWPAAWRASGFCPTAACWPGLVLAAGGLALAWSFWDQGRQVRRSQYRRWYWTRPDRLILGVSLLAVLIWLAAWLFQADWLFYYPYPPYSPWPTFQPILGVAALLVVAPAFLPGAQAKAIQA